MYIYVKWYTLNCSDMYMWREGYPEKKNYLLPKVSHGQAIPSNLLRARLDSDI